MAKVSKVKITLVKSLISCKEDQIATAHALGLKKINDFTVQPENACTAGKIKKIVHLIQVENVK